MELVTGHAGSDHVRSALAGSMHAGIVGTGTYALGTGSRLAATMQSANVVRIADGDLMVQGRHATIEAGQYDELTIQNGTQAQKRNDLVVAHYERKTSSPYTESMDLRVIKGTPTSGTPTDPEYQEGDILAGDAVVEVPLYRIPLDGITPGDPVPLFDVLLPMADLWDSVSQAIDDWIACIRVGKIGIIIADNIASDKAGGYTTYTMPDGMVPDDSLLSDSSNTGFSAPLSYRGKPSEGQSGFMSLTKKSGAWYLDVWTSTTAKYYLSELVFPIR